MNTINPKTQSASYWDWIPSRKTVAAVAAFTTLATTTIGLTYLYCTATNPTEHSYNPLSSENSMPTGLANATPAVVGNASLAIFNGLGMMAAHAHVFNAQNQQPLEKIPDERSVEVQNRESKPQLQLEEEPQKITFSLSVKTTSGESILIQLPVKTKLQLEAFLASPEFEQLLNKTSKNISSVKIVEIEKCDEMLKQTRLELFKCQASASFGGNQSKFELPKNTGLTSNLKIAEELLKETVKAIPFSPNNLARSRKLLDQRAREQGLELKDLSPIGDAAYQCTSKTWELAHSETSGQSSFARRKVLSQLTEKTKNGVCSQMATVAFFKGLEKGAWNTQLDIVSIHNGNHEFLVIGRKLGLDPSDYRTWGSSAVVLDTWAKKNQIYPLSEVETYLNAYLGFDGATGEPRLTPFDSQTHYLQSQIENVFSVQAVENYAARISMDAEQTSHYRKAIEKLEQFHQTEYFQTKLEVAKELVKICSENSIASIESIRLLREKIEYFIELSHLWMNQNPVEQAGSKSN